MQIRKLDKNTFDVFGETGFDNWTRVRRFHWGYKQIGGNFLPRPVMQEVSTALVKFPNGSLENIHAA